jgi:glycosyltransferase involved in cell wall biosynthesis
MKILFLIPYPLNESPSQRFRFEQYFEILKSDGFDYQTQSFLDHDNWKHFAEPGKYFFKLMTLVFGYIKRCRILFRVNQYDFIFVHREITPIGPPVFEWIITRVCKKKLIYDFDDAIWLSDRRHETRLFQFVKWRSKVKNICRWSHKVSCGNAYLCDFAKQFNNHVVLNPTTIDTEKLHNPDLYKKDEHDSTIVIGWTGSYSTLKYLEDLQPVLKKIEENFNVSFMVVADRPPQLHLNSLTFLQWNITTEMTDLLKFDIGIMPLPDDEWAKGKCGFKALQYMAMGIPTIASPVGVNPSIIEHGVSGLLASSPVDWIKNLQLLISNKQLRYCLKKNSRSKVIGQFSVASNAPTFLSLFQSS